MTDARYAALTGALGLSPNDLAEIGGFSDRFARDLVAGRRARPAGRSARPGSWKKSEKRRQLPSVCISQKVS